jgi:Na+/H+-dicarboxylate symporter
MLPLGYSFNLMVDVHDFQVFLLHKLMVQLDLGTQMTMLLLMLTSKGIAGCGV